MKIRRALPACVTALVLAAPNASGQLDPQPIAEVGLLVSGRMVCTDMNGDSHPDLVTVSDDFGGFTGAVLFNDGAGVFDLLFADFFDSDDGADAAAGDWDADGLMDVLLLEERNSSFDSIRLARQVTPGDWVNTDELSIADGHNRIVTCDVNGDGQVDILLGSATAGIIEVYLNTGTGLVAGLVPDIYAMGPVTDFVCCDLDGDGDADLASIDGGVLRVRFNNGAGTFGASVVYILSASLSSIACSDLDGDTVPDLVVTRSSDDTMQVLLNNGAGTFSVETPVGTIDNPLRVTCGDFNCDGDVDVAVGNGAVASRVIQVLYNDGTGTAWQIDPEFGGTIIDIQDLYAVELDNNPGMDLLALRSGGAVRAHPFFNITPACSNCLAPPDDMVAWYDGQLCQPFDVLKNHDGSFTGLLSCPIPLVGGFAMAFGSAPPTYVTVANECDLTPDDHGYTFNAWLRTTGTGFQPIAALGGGPGYDFSLSDGRLRVVVCDSTFCWLTIGSSLINEGEWHHVAFTITRGPMSVIRIWVDGHLEDTTLASLGVVDPSPPLLLGASPSPTPSSYLDGAMDEIQIFERALSAGEIQAIYLAGLAGQCPAGLCAPMGEGESPETQLFEAGVEDDFTLPTEPATPGAVLATVCTISEDFDIVPSSRTICHTFTGLPDDITGGTLEIRIRANASSLPCNDTIQLQASGSPASLAWTRRIGAPGVLSCAGDEGLLDCEWSAAQTHTFCLDLAALPLVGGGTISVIDTLNTTDRLDVRIQDDSGVDYMRLRLAVCPCAGDATCDGSVDVSDLLDVLADWGPCPLPCPPCASDVTGDCVVDVADLLEVLGGWGPC